MGNVSPLSLRWYDRYSVFVNTCWLLLYRSATEYHLIALTHNLIALIGLVHIIHLSL